MNGKEWAGVTHRMFEVFWQTSQEPGKPYRATELEDKKIAAPRQVAPMIKELFKKHREVPSDSIMTVQKAQVGHRREWVFQWNAEMVGTPPPDAKQRHFTARARGTA